MIWARNSRRAFRFMMVLLRVVLYSGGFFALGAICWGILNNQPRLVGWAIVFFLIWIYVLNRIYWYAHRCPSCGCPLLWRSGQCPFNEIFFEHGSFMSFEKYGDEACDPHPWYAAGEPSHEEECCDECYKNKYDPTDCPCDCHKLCRGGT